MARQLRIEFPGACYHVINRGVEQREIFRDESEFARFLRALDELRGSSGVVLHAYCLMPNHYHLFIQTPNAGLRKFMQELNARYARWFNARHHRVGPLFQGRYRALLVEADSRVIALVRYVHRNPVVAGLCGSVGEWKWSSAAAYLGRTSAPDWLETGLVTRLHGSAQQAARKAMFEAWERSGSEEQDWMRLTQGGSLAGTESWVRGLQRRVIPVRADGSISHLRTLRHPPRVVYDALQKRVTSMGVGPRLGRQLLMYALRRSTPLTEQEIAVLTGAPTGMAVGQAIHRLKAARLKDPAIAGLMGRLDKQLRGVSMSNVKL